MDDARERYVLDWLADIVAGHLGELGPVDDALADHLLRERLAPLAAACGGRHPTLAAAQRRCLVETTAIEKVTGRCVDVLGTAGIRCAALKGPALAAGYWPDPSVRGSSDVDLLVAPTDLARARALLLDAGFAERLLYPDWYLRRWHYHLTLLSRDPTVSVELHWLFCRPY
ncbi:MAG TPA: nucleotidyltransferase family protein, partial [Thermoleophilia bacterium]|nr:nucleotidyltransferase family protein [Thermoleophilia bacterium]